MAWIGANGRRACSLDWGKGKEGMWPGLGQMEGGHVAWIGVKGRRTCSLDWGKDKEGM